MKEEISALIQYRIEQAQTALEDARFLLEGKRSPQSIVNGLITRCFMQR